MPGVRVNRATIDGEGRPETGAQIRATNSELHPQLLKVLRG